MDFETNLATNNESGVKTTAIRVIFQLIVSMNIRVAIMVTMPEKNCEKPSKRPSASWSTSAITLLTSSPCGWESMYLSGRISIFLKALSLISRTVSKVMRLFTMFIIHCISAADAATIPAFVRYFATAPRFTPFSTILSIASPKIMGT